MPIVLASYHEVLVLQRKNTSSAVNTTGVSPHPCPSSHRKQATSSSPFTVEETEA